MIPLSLYLSTRSQDIEGAGLFRMQPFHTVPYNRSDRPGWLLRSRPLLPLSLHSALGCQAGNGLGQIHFPRIRRAFYFSRNDLPWAFFVRATSR